MFNRDSLTVTAVTIAFLVGGPLAALPPGPPPPPAGARFGQSPGPRGGLVRLLFSPVRAAVRVVRALPRAAFGP